MLSIESQRSEMRRVLDAAPDVTIVEVIEESKSAMSPGRPKFEAMMKRIEAGEADGIAAWSPDRLARNAVDGGRIIYAIDCGVIRDLKFSTCTFENNSQGKFMLQIMFGQSKYYSDNLSEVVKRGNRMKLEKGWRPNRAPLGYRNDPATKTIEPHPVYFPMVRQLFQLVTRDGLSARAATRVARDQWGFVTPPMHGKPGVPLPYSTTCRILTDPFYAGVIVWKGQTYPGRHEPAVGLETFRRLNPPPLPASYKAKHFAIAPAYRGLIRCACGLRVTTEPKINRQGHEYLYYHCSGRTPFVGCRERSVESRKLDAQIAARLTSFRIPERIEAWVYKRLNADLAEARALAAAHRATLDAAKANVLREEEALVALRLRGEISDEAFDTSRRRIADARREVDNRFSAMDETQKLIEPGRDIVPFSKYAADWFSKADAAGRALILKIVASNPVLEDGILSFEAAPPWSQLAELAACPSLLGLRDIIEPGPNIEPELKQRIAALAACLSDPAVAERLDRLRTLRAHLAANENAPASEPTQPRPKAERASRALAKS